MKPLPESLDLVEMGKEELDEAKKMNNADIKERKIWSTIYYALFYSAKGALISLGHNPRTHKGVNSLVGKILYKEKKRIDRSKASFYSEARRLREDLDYDPYAIPPNKDLEKAFKLTKKFIEKMETIVKSNIKEE